MHNLTVQATVLSPHVVLEDFSVRHDTKSIIETNILC